MRHLALLLLAMGCSAEADFLALPRSDAAETWIASRSNETPWLIRQLSSDPMPLRVGADSELLLLSYDSPTGLRGDAPLTRADLGSANCAVMTPSEALTLRTDPAAAWERPDALPDSLERVLQGLVRSNCHRCVEFEAQTVVLAPPGGERLADVRALAEIEPDAVLALRPIEGPVCVDRSGTITALTGCPANIETLDGPSKDGRYWAASEHELFELSISADAARCIEERRVAFPTPWRQVELLRVSRTSEELEVFVLGVATSTTWRVLRFDGSELAVAHELPREQGDYRDILPVGRQDLLFTNQYETVRWTRGEVTVIPTAPVSRVLGFSNVPGMGVFALATLDLAVVALEIDLESNRVAPPIVLAELADRIQVLTPFRGGFVGLHRGGQVIEFHLDLGLCPTRTELGDNNHTPVFSVPFSDGTWVTDSNGEQRGPSVTWFTPKPPEPPLATEL